jgi:hypothetical protein
MRENSFLAEHLIFLLKIKVNFPLKRNDGMERKGKEEGLRNEKEGQNKILEDRFERPECFSCKVVCF